MSRLLRRTLVSVFCLSLTSGIALAQPPKKQDTPKKPFQPPANVTFEKDVQYGQAGEAKLLLDILQPKQPSDKPRPAIVFIHGGGWSGGSKESALGQLAPFAASGDYFCATVEYRLSGEAIWPAQIHDCKAAIRWLKANAKKYNIDPEKIGIWGGSAGGHLVSMLGVSAGAKQLEGTNGSPDQTSRVACVVDYCGPSDFLGIAAVKASPKQGAYSPISKLLGGPIEEKQEAAAAASPVTYASKNAAPILIVHGTDDTTVPIQQADVFYAALKKAGADATYIKVVGGSHNVGGSGGAELLERVQKFFDKYLRGKNAQVSAEPIQGQALPAKK